MFLLNHMGVQVPRVLRSLVGSTCRAASVVSKKGVTTNNTLPLQ